MLIALLYGFAVALLISYALNFLESNIFTVILWIGIAIISVSLICIIPEIVSSKTISDEIALYKTENENIKQEVISIMKNSEYEEYNNLKNIEKENLGVIIAVHPELLVKDNIRIHFNIYNENIERIKELQKKEINAMGFKWLILGKSMNWTTIRKE